MSRFSSSFVLTAATAMVAGSMLAPAAAFADVSSDLPQEQVAAVVEAGTVYLSGTWSGFVNYPTPDGGTAWSDAVDASFSCSGFVASSDGYIVTAGHCADVAEGKTALVDQFLSNEVTNGDITSDDAQGYLAGGAESNWPVEGQQSGAAPVLAMKVYPAITITGDTAAGYPAVLQDDRPISQGDVALFKIDTPSPLPVLLVSPNQPSTGQKVDAVGYPGNVSGLVSGNPQPTFAQGLVSGRQQTAGGPFTQIGVAMSPGMSGGPVVNGQGDVLGTVSFGPSNDTQQLNFAAAPETITALLTRSGVKNTLSDVDTLYRKGLNEYFSGRYHDAAADLGTVVSRDPSNAIAQQYQTKAIAAFPQEDTTPWLLIFVLGGVALLVVILVVVLLLVLAARRRRRRGAVVGAPVVAAGYGAVAPIPVPGAAPAATPAAPAEPGVSQAPEASVGPVSEQ
ncbi:MULTISPECIES: S1 family peptidase [Subtercola]|uniref:Serine protease n=1 Tax=Subtercola vilae TaxID=2056433 RepID=A0A4T2BK41_9MICO|nr:MULTISPECIES: serine protease [Subtercola]MEA9986740.1 serine protease [Subtercola sp. RTI3]TIH31199.1 serine protease [Subtercola vilae]